MTNNNYRKAKVFFQNEDAGILEETNIGFRFTYNQNFLKKNQTISLSLPLQSEPFENSDLFSFFVGLLPEGWYLDIVNMTLKIDKNDSFGILLATCKDNIGAVSIEEVK